MTEIKILQVKRKTFDPTIGSDDESTPAPLPPSKPSTSKVLKAAAAPQRVMKLKRTSAVQGETQKKYRAAPASAAVTSPPTPPPSAPLPKPKPDELIENRRPTPVPDSPEPIVSRRVSSKQTTPPPPPPSPGKPGYRTSQESQPGGKRRRIERLPPSMPTPPSPGKSNDEPGCNHPKPAEFQAIVLERLVDLQKTQDKYLDAFMACLQLLGETKSKDKTSPRDAKINWNEINRILEAHK